MLNDCPDWELNPGPLSYWSDALPTELLRHLDTLSKSLRLIANHWAHEYREKTTPSRIFMPCNLSSCRVSICWCMSWDSGLRWLGLSAARAEGDLTLVTDVVVILYHHTTGYLIYRLTMDMICFHIPLPQTWGAHGLSDEVHWFENLSRLEYLMVSSTKFRACLIVERFDRAAVLIVNHTAAADRTFNSRLCYVNILTVVIDTIL